MGQCCSGGNKQQRREEERLASAEVRAKAAEAAQRRQEQFEKSAAGRAARAQMEGAAKQSANQPNPNRGKPVLQVLRACSGVPVVVIAILANGLS
ncbi:hypothetical protein FNV43_RR11728 [Rhamnella rubrinervis]|uniref:Small VCP/p97-interacting protein n=1 Tax=Rhamnella rubrinervis TaxID=2594499 RepID=A0A8K0H6Y9_9ROSA|nr:hypothetical protein FNV43_RR11728 [Rhamnella rubrinervis]